MDKPVVALLAWYASSRRVFSWREDRSPYKVAVSEIMLQQTRIATVVPKFDAFVKAFPSWGDLASANPDDVAKLWEGLGYYSRARNLQKSSQIITTQFGGEIPQKADEIAKLPGFGPYTSASIASLCFGEKTPAIDGNVLRVSARFLGLGLSYDDPKLKADARSLLLGWMEDGHPGEINEATMELGETICLPNGAPDCSACPFASCCKAHQKGIEEKYPLPKKKTKVVPLPYTVLVFRCQDEIALELREPGHLLAGLYAFPMMEGHLNESELDDTLQDMAISQIQPLGNKTFHFTHRTWDMVAYEIELKKKTDLYRFYPLEEVRNQLALPTAHRFAFNAVCQNVSKG